MRVWRIRFKLAGGHVHCRLFCAKQRNTTFAKCGELVVEKGDEFQNLMAAMDGVEFLGEDETQGVMEACRP